MRSFLGRDILSLKDMEREEYFQIFSVADRLKPFAAERRNGDLLKHKTLLTAFYQPSTRTRLATEAAMHRLGGHVLGFSDAKMTRAGDFYQETIKDTVHMLEYYGDVIAMRHFQQGAPHEAAKWSSVPVINIQGTDTDLNALTGLPTVGTLGLKARAAVMRASVSFRPLMGSVSPLTASVVAAPKEWPDIPTLAKSNRPASGWAGSWFQRANWSSTAGTSFTRSRKLSSDAARRSAAIRCRTGLSFHTESSLPGCCRNTAT